MATFKWNTVFAAVILVIYIEQCSPAAIQSVKNEPLKNRFGDDEGSVNLQTAAFNEPSSIDDEESGILPLVDAPRHDTVKPLKIVVDDDFSKWKQLPNQTSTEVESMKVNYALDILNNKLPKDLEKCYRNMSMEVLQSDIYDPASYGERLCGNLAKAEKCIAIKVVKGQDSLTVAFKEEVKYLRAAICDPDCPFAQAESCQTKIVNSTEKIDPCSLSGALSCADSMLAELKCRPEAPAVVYWYRRKMLGKLRDCDYQPEGCVTHVQTCLQPLSDYLIHADVEQLCRREKLMKYCVTAVRHCVNTSYTVTHLLGSLHNLLDGICHQEEDK